MRLALLLRMMCVPGLVARLRSKPGRATERLGSRLPSAPTYQVCLDAFRARLGTAVAAPGVPLGSSELQAISAASFFIWVVYIAGELSSVGVHALSSAAEGAGDRGEGVGTAVVQGLWFSLGTSAVLAALASGPLLARYFAVVGGSLRDALLVA